MGGVSTSHLQDCVGSLQDPLWQPLGDNRDEYDLDLGSKSDSVWSVPGLGVRLESQVPCLVQVSVESPIGRTLGEGHLLLGTRRYRPRQVELFGVRSGTAVRKRKSPEGGSYEEREDWTSSLPVK